MDIGALTLIVLCVLVIPLLAVFWLAKRVADTTEIIQLEDAWIRCEINAQYSPKMRRYWQAIHIRFQDASGAVLHEVNMDRWGTGRLLGFKRQLQMDGWRTLQDDKIDHEDGTQTMQAVYRREGDD